ncbi:poly-gamma-glutamate hydrolase family protein [Priestia megaterium]|uniref:poly-gamma-glutamate hydrolase family protein n=1 Tax=Priestia megaterium TaxID=1404 RepID=UPI0023DA8D5A|nr:poly-gamma-glutamate hydrolase family protein [Priestia megaterium]MDF2010194.1 poly-gamma-glutamate hydrolase family protein [Priestia megaterium]
MADLYNNFAELFADNTYETDYHVLAGIRDSNILFSAVHGGGIESGTTELAMFSGGSEFNFYAFEGWRGSGNTSLHITSTHWDEPTGMKLFKSVDYTISYHGYSSSTKNTKLGGLDAGLRNLILRNLTNAGFSAEIEGEGSNIAGVNPTNLVNVNKRGMGVQLEISTAQRSAFFNTNTRSERRNTINDEFTNYMNAVVSAVREYTGN